MSFETDLAKFKKQVDSFSIAGAAGNFHTGFNIGDDTRGAGAGVGGTTPNTPEEVLRHLENSFKNFTIRGGHDVSVSGSLVGGGFAISAKGGVPQEGTGGGPPEEVFGCTDPEADNFNLDATTDDGSCTYSGACCVDVDCSVVSETECTDMSGIYKGDGTTCEEVDCSLGACCFDTGECFELTADDCATDEGFFQGTGTVCDPNPCIGPCPADEVDLTVDIVDLVLCSMGDPSPINTTHTVTSAAAGLWQTSFFADGHTLVLSVTCTEDIEGINHFNVDLERSAGGGGAVFLFGGENLALMGVEVPNTFSLGCTSPWEAFNGTATITW